MESRIRSEASERRRVLGESVEGPRDVVRSHGLNLDVVSEWSGGAVLLSPKAIECRVPFEFERGFFQRGPLFAAPSQAPPEPFLELELIQGD
jgi:hypothetical protein